MGMTDPNTVSESVVWKAPNSLQQIHVQPEIEWGFYQSHFRIR